MKILRVVIFLVSMLLSIWLLGPLYKHIVHIGMLYPLPFLFLFMLFSVRPDFLKFLFKNYKVLSITVSSLIGVGIVIFTSLVGVMLVNSGGTPSKNKTVVILGCQVSGTRPTLMLYDRMNTALEYINNNPDCAIVASGGKGPGEKISEAKAIKNYLVSKGVDENRIFMEENSVNTDENLRFSKKVIEENGLNKDIVVVTDGFHEFRGLHFAKQNGLNPEALPCNTRWYLSLSYYSREVLAIIKMIIL